MQLKNAVALIVWHAGLPSDIEGEGEPLSDVLYKLRGINSGSIKSQADNIVSCLQVINLDLNGNIPSQNKGEFLAIPRKLSAAMASIWFDGMKTCRQIADNSIKRETEKYLWKIACAWDAVQAGDIDDIIHHVELEEICE